MIAVEDEVFAQLNEAQFGTFDMAKATAGKTKRQRKRTNSRSHSSDGDDPTSPMSDDFPKLKLDASFKRDRRSRMGTRGLPKKGGAGGKGVWGKAGDELNAPTVKDDQDPNFDAQDMAGKDIKLGAYIPELDKEEIEKNIKPLLLEYYENGELEECIQAICNFNIGLHVGHVLLLAVSVALERNASTKELCSRLIAEFYGRVIDPMYMEDAFVKLLKSIPDLELDNPGAAEDTGKFVARAIADDCLAPAFLKRLASYDLVKQSQKAVLTASSLLTMKFAMSKISNIWGVAGLDTPTKYYSNKLWFILKEYLKSCEQDEVKTSLRELDIPHFHHEVVFEGIVLVMEQRPAEFEKHAQIMIDLLQFLGKTSIITRTQFESGFKRVSDDLDDLTLDIPNAISLFTQFCDMCVAQTFMSVETYESINPNRGRKRFVSEGDGGRIKTTI